MNVTEIVDTTTKLGYEIVSLSRYDLTVRPYHGHTPGMTPEVEITISLKSGGQINDRLLRTVLHDIESDYIHRSYGVDRRSPHV